MTLKFLLSAALLMASLILGGCNDASEEEEPQLDAQQTLDRVLQAVDGVAGVEKAEVRVTEELSEPEFSDGSTTETTCPDDPDIECNQINPFVRYFREVATGQDSYVEEYWLDPPPDDCSVVNLACLEFVHAQCKSRGPECPDGHLDTLNYQGEIYFRADSPPNWERQPEADQRPDADGRLCGEPDPNELTRDQFNYFLDFVKSVDEVSEVNLEGREALRLDLEIEPGQLQPRPGCDLPSPAFTGYSASGTASVWVDPESYLPIKGYLELSHKQNERILVQEWRLADYSKYNEAELPGPLPE